MLITENHHGNNDKGLADHLFHTLLKTDLCLHIIFFFPRGEWMQRVKAVSNMSTSQAMRKCQTNKHTERQAH